MATIPFTVVDVFSTTAFKGNPLAIVDNTSGILTTTQMQLLTRQFNLSETTFFSEPTVPNATYWLRSFLPEGKEVFGAGHNILGVWWYLAHAGLLKFSEHAFTTTNGVDTFEFHQQLGDQVLPVKILRSEGDSGKPHFSVSIRQAAPKFHEYHPDSAALAKAIGLEASEIGFAKEDGTLVNKPQVLSTSTTHHLQIPVSSVGQLNQVNFQRDKVLQQLALVNKKAYGVYFFTPVPSSGTNAYQARFFSPGMSGEDPATGSAAGPLSAYLYYHGQLKLVDGRGQIVVQQGLRVGRECVINVTITASGEKEHETLEVDFEGSGVVVATGDIALPDPNIRF